MLLVYYLYAKQHNLDVLSAVNFEANKYLTMRP